MRQFKFKHVLCYYFKNIILNAMSAAFCFLANHHHYTSLYQLSLEHTCAAVYPAQYKFCATTSGETSINKAKYIITNSMRNHRRTNMYMQS
jgi:hypothetical protein